MRSERKTVKGKGERRGGELKGEEGRGGQLRGGKERRRAEGKGRERRRVDGRGREGRRCCCLGTTSTANVDFPFAAHSAHSDFDMLILNHLNLQFLT